jgi:hypothetical protein
MFWGSFFYNRKGLMHIWISKTNQERKEAKKELNIINIVRKPLLQEKWEFNTAVMNADFSCLESVRGMLLY